MTLYVKRDGLTSLRGLENQEDAPDEASGTGVELRGAIEPEKDRGTKAFSTCSNVIDQVVKERKKGLLRLQEENNENKFQHFL